MKLNVTYDARVRIHPLSEFDNPDTLPAVVVAYNKAVAILKSSPLLKDVWISEPCFQMYGLPRGAYIRVTLSIEMSEIRSGVDTFLADHLMELLWEAIGRDNLYIRTAMKVQVMDTDYDLKSETVEEIATRLEKLAEAEGLDPSHFDDLVYDIHSKYGGETGADTINNNGFLCQFAYILGVEVDKGTGEKFIRDKILELSEELGTRDWVVQVSTGSYVTQRLTVEATTNDGAKQAALDATTNEVWSTDGYEEPYQFEVMPV